MADLTTNTPYLIACFAAVAWSNMIAGFTLNGLATTGNTLKIKLGWEDKADVYLEYIVSAQIIGLMMGALLGGKILYIGRKNTILLLNVTAALAASQGLYLNFWAIFISRAVVATCAGAMIVAGSIFLKETIPAEKLSLYGTAVNFGIVLGLLVSICMQGALPTTPDEMLMTGYWRIILGAPIVLCLTNSIFWLIVMKHDSIDFCIEQDNLVAAKCHLELVYKFQSAQQSTDTLNNLKQVREAEKLEQAIQPGIWEVFISPKYRACTIFVTISAVLN